MRIQSCEIFESSVERCPSCDAYVMDKAEAFEHEQGCDETETETLAGLFYWNCQPGCLPDSEAFGPFKTEAEAINDAAENGFIEARFEYHINLDERGSFYADVRDACENTLYEIKSDDETGEIEQVSDGFMKHARDVDGLEKYLKQMEILPSWGYLESA